MERLSNELICFHLAAVDTANESVAPEPKTNKEAINFKEVKRIDAILASLQRKVFQFSQFVFEVIDKVLNSHA